MIVVEPVESGASDVVEELKTARCRAPSLLTCLKSDTSQHRVCVFLLVVTDVGSTWSLCRLGSAQLTKSMMSTDGLRVGTMP